jgi:hypothetical protein
MSDTSIRLHLAGRAETIPLSGVLMALQALQSMLRSLDEAYRGAGGRPTAWHLSEAAMKSPLCVEVAPSSDADLQRADAVVADCVNGLATLDRIAEVPPRFRLKTLEAARELVSPLGDGVAEMSIEAAGRATPVTLRIAANVSDLTRPQKRPGTVEGMLDRVNAHSDLKFYVYDPLADRRVPCAFGDPLREAVRKALYGRVTVVGTVTYDRDGVPISIVAESVEPFPDPSELPQFFEVPPIDITGGMDPADYIEGLYEDA